MQTNYYSTTGTTPQRAPPGYDMNHLYLSPSHQQANRPGIFLKRNEKIDWRRMAAVDVDRIARDMDFQALQDNLEQITLCNIDTEIDSRAMDPNFIKLYKMAQLTIEYLLLCQDQITTQLADYDQIKSKGFYEHEGAHREIEKLKNDLAETKKESKKRRKMLETQQRMLMAQNSNYHTCPVCTHAFLSVNYLQAHIKRRHPDYDSSRRREHDVDIEKDIQHLKDQLNKKENELQLVKVQKAVDEEKIRERDTTIRQLKEEIHTLTTKMTILDDRFTHMRSNGLTRSPSPHRNDNSVSELLKENKGLRDDIEQLKKLLQQTENDLKKEQKLKRRYELENENLIKEISKLKENLQLLQNTSGNSSRLSEELISYQNRYNEEKLLRKKLQKELQDAKGYSQDQPVIDRKSPVPSIHSVDSPVQMRSVRPVQQSTDIILRNYCPNLVARLKDNPKYLTRFREEAKRQINDELEDGNLGISETDTRLTDLDFRTKQESVLRTRRNIQEDLPEFERIRADISRTLDRLVTERLDLRRSITSIRSTGGSKLVTFEDEQNREKYTTQKPSFDQRRNPPKSKYDDSRPTINNDSDEDMTISNMHDSDNDESTQRENQHNIQPIPRKNLPTTKGVNALVKTGIKPSQTNEENTISAIVTQPLIKRPSSIVDRFNSDSENESPVPPQHTSNAIEKKRIIEQKLHIYNKNEQKPGINAIAQVIRPSHESLTTQNNDDDVDESESLTTLHTNPPVKPSNGHLPQLSGRESVNNNPLSSGDVSQHTYDSLWKSQHSKGVEHRRPLTADSTKTSMIDSDDNLDGEESN
ncbi:unnamed protein product [Adineta steineri]|uniref:C2H2-type domain-containing protein n=1 Tax=Adineta steineri TaxID=433720 RepID=A0A813PX54_9BILA|nr:unnamed protein product [Adineta steineri]CAF3997335.1 unnamed protein product [Adineta steineri]